MEIKSIITEVRTWLKSAYESITSTDVSRKWCTLGLEKNPTTANIAEHFDREVLNETFKERYNGTDIPSKEVSAYVQSEINLIAASHRSFMVRHKTRLQVYRDDCEQKHYHIKSAINVGYARFLVDRDKSEETR